MKRQLLQLLLLAATQTAQAQKLSPAAKLFTAGLASQDKTTLATGGAVKTANALISVTGANAADSIKALGVKVHGQSNGVVSATLTANQIDALAALPCVRQIDIEAGHHRKMDKARQYSNADPAHKSDNILGRSYMGKDVIFGVEDGGFQFNHITNRAPDGSWRIKRVCHQGSYGNEDTELTTEEEMIKAVSDGMDTHGQHVLGIAAGGDMSQPYYGVAPEADIVIVADPEETASETKAVQYIFDYAKSVGKPAVINLSLGTHNGPHDGTSARDRFFDGITGEGRIIVGSAGNEGLYPIHVRKTFTATDNELKTGFDFGEQEDEETLASGYVWGTAGTTLKAKAVLYDTETGEVIASTPWADTNDEESSTVEVELTESTHGADGHLGVAGSVDSYNKRPNFEVYARLTNLSDNRSVAIFVTGEEGTQVDVWNDDNYTFTGGFDGWTAGDTDCTVGEIGGTGKSVISVGSYHTRTKVATLAGGQMPSPENTFDQPIGSESLFSSKGPTLDGRMKPDVSAPGWVIVSAYNEHMPDFSEDEVVAVSEDEDGEQYYYTAMGGTSMSSPYVAGSVALWLEACPTLTPDDVRDILRETAINDEYTQTGVNIWGYGKIDTFAGLAAAVKKQTGIARVPGTDILPRADVSQSLGRLTVTFRQDQGKSAVTLLNTQGVTVASATLPSTTTGSTVSFDTSSLTPGVYLVRVGGEQGQPQTLKVSVK